MNYEEKYNEALERAKSFQEKYGGDYAGYIFPELVESEDEKALRIIRKRMCYDPVPISDEDRRIVENWLEKQKENPKSSDSIPSDCTSDAKCEDRWHKVTYSLPDNGRLVLAKDCLGNVLLARYDGENWEVNVYDNEDHYCHNSISKWCEIPSEKQQESLHIPETSKENANSFTDEDEMIIDGMLEFFRFSYHCDDIDQKKLDLWIAYLEKQKEQLTDESFDSLFDDYCDAHPDGLTLEECGKFFFSKGFSKGKLVATNDFSLALAERYCQGLRDGQEEHWKPSEEQMEALERASTNEYLSAKQFDILVSLYEQLKKL